eukprot:CAMPEP_0172472656 /NCGR_PEP_ID=MMETSP1065-20121228/68453_1 /TAXON_ID=265537 /ORGANISM="Amphiprora paludosa, Strain CCMP125" /LENGTH=189 /DNA_ID=CAMNT_0013230807 /DNA_START=114 /DNA_END=683 /DNA_ORIENTATION=+
MTPPLSALSHPDDPADVNPLASLAHTVRTAAFTLTLVAGLLSSNVALAQDFAQKDISGQDFSGQDLSHQDFTGVIAKQTNFHNCNLQGAIFTQGILTNADFSGANVEQVNFVDATLDGTNFKDALAERAVFSGTILDIGSLENADLTRTIWPSKYRIMICDMDTVKGVNEKTGANTYESLMCIDYYRKS